MSSAKDTAMSSAKDTAVSSAKDTAMSSAKDTAASGAKGPSPQDMEEAAKAAYASGLLVTRLALEDLAEHAGFAAADRARLADEAFKREPLLKEPVALNITVNGREVYLTWERVGDDYDIAAEQKKIGAVGRPEDLQRLIGGVQKQMSFAIYTARAAFREFAGRHGEQKEGDDPGILRTYLGATIAPDDPVGRATLGGIFAVDAALMTLALVPGKRYGLRLVISSPSP